MNAARSAAPHSKQQILVLIAKAFADRGIRQSQGPGDGPSSLSDVLGGNGVDYRARGLEISSFIQFPRIVCSRRFPFQE